MKFKLYFLLASVFLFHLNLMAQTPSWQSVGTSGSCGQMDLDGSGNIYVLSSNAVYKYNGSSWTSLGNPYSSYTGSNPIYYTNLSVSAAGTPYVTYHFESATTPPSHIRSYVSYYNGSSWTTLGGADMGSDVETHFPVYDAVTGFGVVTDATTSNRYLRIKKINVSSWTTPASIPITLSAINSYTAIAHDNGGNTYVLYYESALKVVKIASDGSYTSLGTSISPSFFCSNCHGWMLPFYVSTSGTVYVGYLSQISTTEYKFIVNWYDGSNWQTMQEHSITSATAINISKPSITVSANGTVFLGYSVSGSSSYGKIVYYDGAAWTEVGTQNFFSVGSIKVSTGNILYKDGCEKYDVSNLALVTANVEGKIEEKASIYADEKGIVISSLEAGGTAYVYDQIGQLLVEEVVESNTKLTIPLQKNGVYIVKVQDKKGTMDTKKIMFVK